MLPYLDDAAAVLSVGGDNYSLDYGVPKLFTDLDDIVLEKKKPLAIWGASVGPFQRDAGL
jgi:colanic acid/amylovoran biosynthesis protein